ncbi:MAG: Glutamate-semialdehyde aminotransferase [Myxococcales bacterium]|nr:Glutamate-semialdehyde aminotransferase [Myxococcales bacterium]
MSHRLISLIAQFEAQVIRTPSAPCVTFEGTSLDYGQLNAQSNQLAHELRILGVGLQSRVAVCLDRSLDLVVALLGTLKAGASYVPLDPNYPADRLEFMLDDSHASVLVTQAQHRQKLPAPRVPALLFPDDKRRLEAHPAVNMDGGPAPQSPAYVIYTSGSTGKPKGVVIPHSAICNHMTWMQAQFPLGVTDRVLQKTPYSFDASVWEFYAPLLSGAVLVLARPDGHRDASYLIETIRRQEITILQVVPSLLRMLLDEKAFDDCHSLRRVYCGGEPLLPADVRAFHDRLGADLINLYGPTECTIDTVFWQSDRTNRASIPIGRSVSGTSAYVLDDDMNAVATGSAGELYLSGACLALGYLDRPQLTAEKFLPDPLSAEPGSRMYKTGDLVRRNADGDLEFHGRADSQVKVRGYRIELGEIEAVLTTHPDITRCVVALAEGAIGPRLVAYVVCDTGPAIDAAALRAYLQQRIPDYMVPSAFCFLSSLPLTPSGKIDRRSLPPPPNDELDPRPGHVPPHSEIEKQVASIWEDVLGVRPVGLNDDFFLLGGDSVQAHIIVGRIRKALSRKLSIKELFEAPVLGAFVNRLGAPGPRSLPAITRTEGTTDLPLTFAQEGHWLVQRMAPHTPVYNVTVALRFVGHLDVRVLETALDALIARHEILRTTFGFIGDDPVQRIHETVSVPLEHEDISAVTGEEQARILNEKLLQRDLVPFDLQQGPLIRFRLYRLSDSEHVLDMVQHHIVTDEWSIRLMAKEIRFLYAALRNGQPLPVAKPNIRYADYGAWQRQHVSLATLKEQVAYWKQQLSGVPPLKLPTDFPRPTTQSLRADTVRVALADAETTDKLKQLAGRTEASLFMVLHAALSLLLSRVAGQANVAVGTPIAGRTQQETESVLGCFVNTLVLRMKIEGSETFASLVEQSRRATLAAYGAQDLPFQQLLVALRPARAPGWTPLFQCLLQLQKEVVEIDTLEDLAIQLESRPSPGVLFDLFVCLSESEQGLTGVFQFATDLFKRETVEQLVTSFQTLLARVANSPEAIGIAADLWPPPGTRN